MSSCDADARKSDEEIVIKRPYPLNPPFALASVVRDKDGVMRYRISEPDLSERDGAALQRIKELLLEELVLPTSELRSKKDVRRYLRGQVRDKIRRYHIGLSGKGSLQKIFYYIERDFVGYGKIDAMMRDHLIEDVSADGSRIPLYIWHREFESLPTNVVFSTDAELNSFVVRLAYKAGRHISVAKPILDATLPDGSRLQATYGSEVTRRGSTFTIRKFRADPLTIVDLIQLNTLSADVAAYLWYLIENRVSVLVAGGIASGKTTMLNCLATFIRPSLKIVSVEDTAELNLSHENWIPLVSRPSLTERSRVELFDLLKASLRQRPDYIIVGEVRGEEAYVLFQALSIGHLGMSTIHAESVRAVFRRLKSKPMDIPEDLLPSLDIVTLQRRVMRGRRFLRRTIDVSEIVKPEEADLGSDLAHVQGFGRVVRAHTVFLWEPRRDRFQYTGSSFALDRIKRVLGLSDDRVEDELSKRKTILAWMAERGIRRVRDVGSVVESFYIDPEKLLGEIAHEGAPERFGVPENPGRGLRV